MANLNQVRSEPRYTARSAFSPWRWSHQRFIFLERTIVGAAPHLTEPENFREQITPRLAVVRHNLREDWQDEAFFAAQDRPGPSGNADADADAMRCWEYGA